MTNKTLVALGFTLTLPALLSGCGWMMGADQQGHMMNVPLGGHFMILVLIAIVVFIALVLKGVTRGDRVEENPMEIVKRRYASGEIDKEEYERLKKDLADD